MREWFGQLIRIPKRSPSRASMRRLTSSEGRFSRWWRIRTVNPLARRTCFPSSKRSPRCPPIRKCPRLCADCATPDFDCSRSRITLLSRRPSSLSEPDWRISLPAVQRRSGTSLQARARNLSVRGAAIRLSSSSCCMIACHTWDTLGAVAAGWDAALIVRPGNAPLARGPQPHIVGQDLSLVAASLIASYGHCL